MTKQYHSKRGIIELLPLHEDDYFALSAQYEETPAPGDGMYASGEHYKLNFFLGKIDERYKGLDKEDGWNVATELGQCPTRGKKQVSSPAHKFF